MKAAQLFVFALLAPLYSEAANLPNKFDCAHILDYQIVLRESQWFFIRIDYPPSVKNLPENEGKENPVFGPFQSEVKAHEKAHVDCRALINKVYPK